MPGRVRAILIVGSIFLASAAFTGAASAASLSVLPKSGTIMQGQEFVVRVAVSAPDEAVNATQGVLAYPTNILEVANIGTASSIVGAWVSLPSNDPARGQISWSGGIVSPGFKGNSGILFAITFKALAPGAAEVLITSGAAQVLAADGRGTNVLKDISGAAFEIAPAAADKTQPKINNPQHATSNLQPTTYNLQPRVTSLTHPDPAQWYNATTFTVRWALDLKATGVSVMMNDKPAANPGPISDGLFSEKSYSNLANGLYYFHIKFLYPNRQASAITHFPVRIDMTPPETLTMDVKNADNRLHQPVLALKASDTQSGVRYFEIQADNGAVFNADAGAGGEADFTLPVAQSGTYSVTIRAFDRAGNSRSVTKSVTANIIAAPTLLSFPNTVFVGDPILITGKSEPSAVVHWSVRLADGSTLLDTGSAAANGEGFWSVRYERAFGPALYSWRFSQRNTLGAESAETPGQTLEVMNYIRVGPWTMPLRVFLIAAAILIISLVVMFVAALRTYLRLQQRVRRQTLDLEARLAEELSELQAEMSRRLKYLKKLKTVRGLSRNEANIEQSLKRSIEHIERVVAERGKKMV